MEITQKTMVQVKRQQRTSDFAEIITKKLRSTLDDIKMISCFENLSNELYYEIFEYLEGCQLYKAFSNLNIRFQNLLSSPSIQLKIEFNSNSEWHLKSLLHIATSNKHRILSLRLIDSQWSGSFFSLFSIDSSFTRLQSLQLCDIICAEVMSLLVELIYLPCLSSLTIKSDYEILNITDVCQIVFKFPMLNYFKLSCVLSTMFIYQPTVTNEISSNIEYLVLDHNCTLNALVNILSYTPRLIRLSCTEVIHESNRNIAKESLNILSSLTHISIGECKLNFNDMEMFITNVSPQLQVLRVKNFKCLEYLDANRWERMISGHLLHLRILEFKYQERIKNYFVLSDYHAMINKFNSSFWLKKKWFFRLIIDKSSWQGDSIMYSIWSYRERQVNLYADYTAMQEIKSDDSSKILSITNQLNVVDYCSTGEYLPQTISPILYMIPISCLNIMREGILIDTLLNFIKYLPNLDSLVVSSLEIMQRTCLSDWKLSTLRLAGHNNKISKVNLQRIDDLREVKILLDLCPYTEYLEVHCSNSVTPESIVRFILIENIEYIPNLCSLCLEISKMNENIIKKIKKIIDIEPLRHTYTIKQFYNRIYVCIETDKTFVSF